jgi:hypothetical protein
MRQMLRNVRWWKQSFEITVLQTPTVRHMFLIQHNRGHSNLKVSSTQVQDNFLDLIS